MTSTDFDLRTRRRARLALAIAVAAVAGCQGDTAGPGAGTGHLVVHLTDAPFPLDAIDSTVVTIEKIRVHLDASDGESGFYTVDETTRQFDLLELQNGVTDSIGSVDLPTGRINQIRVHTGPARILLTDGREFDLVFPSGSSSGVKVFPTPPIEIVEGETVEILLDFDLSRSFQAIPSSPNHVGEIQGFHFRPVLRACNLAGSGSVEGRVWNDNGNDDPADDTAISGAAVAALLDGTEIASTMSGADGVYALVGLAPDHYQVLGTATGFAPDTLEVSIVAGVAADGEDLFLSPNP